MSTDAQTPFLGTPLVPLQKRLVHSMAVPSDLSPLRGIEAGYLAILQCTFGRKPRRHGDEQSAQAISGFTFYFLKSFKFLLGLLISAFSTLCGPVVSSTGEHGFVLIS